MKKILEILTYADSGGSEMVVYNYLSHMSLKEFKVDVLVLENGKKQSQIDDFEELGCHVINLPKNILKRLIFVKNLIKHQRYDIIHIHSHFLSEFYLYWGKKYGVKARIKHLHIANEQLHGIKAILNNIELFLNQHFATHYFACGKMAYENYWGRYDVNNPKAYIMNNAIDINKFKFSDDVRKSVRKEMAWTDKRVYINVARFTYQKNHDYLLKVFHYLANTDQNAHLVLIGTGELKEQVETQVKLLSLEDKVEFLGNRHDVPRLLNGCDCFLLPSRFEGLPVVGIEAQANGLPIIFSDNITSECDITDIAKNLPITENDIIKWVKTAESLRCDSNRQKYAEVIANAGYSINIEASKLYNFYCQQ